MRTLLLIITLASVSGCAVFDGVVDRVAKGIDTYCQESYAMRLTYRDAINSKLAADGNEIIVTCAGDPSQ